MFAAPRGDPADIARLQFFGICLAGVLILDVLWELFHWWHDTPEDPPNRRQKR